MSGIFYIKLLSGEEIIAGLEKDDGQVVEVSQPLAMESDVDGTDPTRRFVYMSRFSPYAGETTFSIKHSAVAFLVPVSPVMARYYEVSLKYCERFTDPSFSDTMTETSDQIEESLRGSKDSDDPAADLMLRMFSTTFSNTVN